MKRKIIVSLLVTLCCLWAFSIEARADVTVVYVNDIVMGNRGDAPGNFAGSFYGGTVTESFRNFPISIAWGDEINYVGGAPDGNFVSLPGGGSTSASLYLGFGVTFGAVPIFITEIGDDGPASALLYAYTYNWDELYIGTISRQTHNLSETITVDLSPYQDFVDAFGEFSYIYIEGLDGKGTSMGFDLDAIGVDPPSLGSGGFGDDDNHSVPEPGTLLSLAAGLIGLAGFRARSRK